MRRIPLSVPHLAGNEATYLRECVETNWVSYLGPFVERFEREFAARVGTSHAVATNSGTAALHLALLAAGIRPGDEVIVPDLTFIATANAVTYCGAHPVFIDVTSTEWQLDVAEVARFLEAECQITPDGTIDRLTGRRVAAVIPVHLLGHPVDMDPLLSLARRHRLTVIEDASEALGALYKGRPVGSLGDISCFSFNGNKIITSGGGGMVCTESSAIAQRARYLSTQARDDRREYVHENVGYNYRLTNLQAAVGVAQLERLDDHVRRKREIAARYATELGVLNGIGLPRQAEWALSTYWLYTIALRAVDLAPSVFVDELEKAGIEARRLWAPLHLQTPYRDARTGDLRRSVEIYDRAVSLPSSVGLDDTAQDHVISTVKRISSAAELTPTL